MTAPGRRRQRGRARLVAAVWVAAWRIDVIPDALLAATFLAAAGLAGLLWASTTRSWNQPVPRRPVGWGDDWQASMDHRDPPLHLIRDGIEGDR